MSTASKFVKVTAVLFCILMPAGLYAEVIEIDDLPQLRHTELGDIGSDGESGRQLHVRQLLDSEVDRGWVFFPPHSQMPNVYSDPTPPSPCQDSLYLTEEMSLVVVIPQLQHFPSFAEINVEYSLVGNTITIDALLHYGSAMTATIYGPHEYLLSIGELQTGQYYLDFNLTQTDSFSDFVTTTSGFMEFQVHAVPEPSTISLVIVGFVLMGFCRRRIRQYRAI